MKKYVIKKIEDTLTFQNSFSSFKDISFLKIEKINWGSYSYKPEVKLKIAWNDKGFFLEYNVKEKHLRVEQIGFSGPVHKDSCVEFFVTIDQINYYNFEFNATGSRHVNYRSILTKEKKVISKSKLESIKIKSSEKQFTRLDKQNANWLLQVFIPFTFFSEKNIPSKQLKGNFYKCGDKLIEPHYLSWNPIETKIPDFHQPNFFGELILE